MDSARLRLLFFFWLALLSTALNITVQGGDVTYDRRSLIIDGQHKILFSGSIHYPRSTPDTWALSSETLYEKANLPTNSNGATYYVKAAFDVTYVPSLISKAKEGGLDVIQTYAFWNLHEPQQGQYDFSGRADIVRFMKEIRAQGLYACLRIGPFIEAEWSYGGFPFWLHDIPGIVFRSDNEPFKYQMQRFVTKIVSLMKSENLYASQGGPIILSQIENEYQMVEAAFHEKGPSYVRWAAAMAVGLQTGVPWVMSKQDDAPDPVINACNGMSCGETFAGPNSPKKPSIWTENWTSWYQVYGGEPYIRSAQDIAFQVALFIAKNGSYVNYYMYHGGTNFGRAASAFVTTSYYDEAPLDEYGLTKQPKWGHLKELHATIKSCSNALLHGLQNKNPLGEMQDAYVFKGNSGECTAFLVNNDKKRDVKVLFQNVEYELPQHSVSILPDCKTIAFNTARISAQYTTRSTALRQKYNSIKKWRQYQEGGVEFEKTTLRAKMLLDHMSATKDRSDYLWYTFRFQHNSSNVQAVLNALSYGHILHAYVNGIYVGTAHGSHQNTGFTFEKTIDLRNGTNNISLLSVMVGLPDSGAYLERKVAGLRRVRIQNKDFTDIAWGYQVGLLGEELQIYTHSGAKKVQWNKLGSTADQRLTWYKTIIDAPGGNDPLALNLGSMGKGQAWINGQSIGRYWTSFHTSKGTPSQIRYHVPRSFLKPKGNLLVLLEEENGYPAGITMDTISIAKVCIHVAESNASAIKLTCPQRRNIARILFASFGTTSGNCENYAIGNCHSSNSRAKIEKTCIGKNNCSIIQSSQFFGGDPCPGIPKSLLVDVKCT